MTTTPLYVPTEAEAGDNPHACILDTVPCLACAIIDVLGDDRRGEALEIAAAIAERHTDLEIAEAAGRA